MATALFAEEATTSINNRDAAGGECSFDDWGSTASSSCCFADADETTIAAPTSTSTTTSSKGRTTGETEGTATTTPPPTSFTATTSIDNEDEHIMSSEQQQQQQQQHYLIIENIPKQLHPAVSMGMRRVSSCYFSVRSEEAASSSVVDLLSFLDSHNNNNNEDIFMNNNDCNDNNNDPTGVVGGGIESSNESSSATCDRKTFVRQESVSSAAAEETSSSSPSWSTSSSDLLYHDILMNVFTFLDAPALSAVSETARRLNFEVFYFLGLHLQKTLIPAAAAAAAAAGCHSALDDNNSNSNLSAITGISTVRRLANLNRSQADVLVKEFLDSNASLQHMPLSHSLAYMRQVFSTQHHFSPSSASSQALASAALFVTLVGAASAASFPSMRPEIITSEIPNMLFRVGFVGSLMKAAKSMTETPPEKLRERAEQVKLQAERVAIRLQEAAMGGHQHHDQDDGSTKMHFPSWSELMRMACNAAYGEKSTEVKAGGCLLMSHDPYSHISATDDDQNGEGKDNNVAGKKTPTGCVGAYLRTVHKANEAVSDIVRQSRRQRFEQFSDVEREDLARQLLESCATDALDRVKTLVHNGVDVDGFCVGADGTETCALHTAAFNGSTSVIEFLCRGIDGENGTHDGGLCDVNRRDANAWSALHFAAGSNSVEAVRILVKHGADWTVEANNGYTALQWALRLQHHQVAEELKQVAVQHKHQSQSYHHGWMAHRPLSAIASRFFALVMVHNS